MPNWGQTDILGLGGKQTAAATAMAMGGAATASSTPQTINGGAVDPATGRPVGAATPGASNSVTPQTPQLINQAGQSSGTHYTMTGSGGPPVPGDRWQGGAADPNGTQAANGRQTGGRYVDPTYQTDANGNQLSAADQAAWRQYDVDRANASTREHDGYLAYKARQAAAADQEGKATNAVYDPITQTYSMVDSKGTWTKGLTVADLQGKLDDNLKKQYPDWWWGQYASQQNQQRRNEVDAGAYDAQRFAQMGQGSTRYGATNF